MANTEISRRSFLAGAAAAGSMMVLPERARGANERINIALIGAGGRGSALLGEALTQGKDLNIGFLGVCDVYRPTRERAAARIKTATGQDALQTSDFQEALAWPDLDAVIIATPDFAHSPILAAAARAGKDAYCEKPMCSDFADAREAYKAVKAANRIVQCGTQHRSEGLYRGAAELIRTGVLGQITRINIAVSFNSERWQRTTTNAREQDVDWKRFLMKLPDRPFDARQLQCWQLYRDFTCGLAGLWGSHYYDLIPFLTGDPFPKSAVAHGGNYVWKAREHADTFHSLHEYPQGFLVSWSMGLGNSAGWVFTVHGTNGTLDCVKWTVSGEGGAGAKKIAAEQPVPKKENIQHMRNWLECLRSREQPTASIEAGIQHSVAVMLAAEAHVRGRRMVYDPATMEIKEG